MSSEPSIYKLINHPYYLLISKYIDACGFKIARSSVRDALKKVGASFDLSKLNEVLTSFFSDLLVIQIDEEVENLNEIITPCFLLHRKENEFSIYLVLKIYEEKAALFEQDKKEHTVSLDDFQNLIKKSILIFKEEETYIPSEQLLKEYNQEQEEDKEYINNVRVIDNFMSEKECEKFISFCEESELFKRSVIMASEADQKHSAHRTSSSAMMEMNQSTPIIEDLKEKIAELLDIKTNKIEKLQCVRYYKSEGFKPHFDSYVKKRKFTCLLYLNEGFVGGETYFPEIDFGVTPKMGRLLIFKNLDKKNNVITQSFHEGSPLLEGVKYACNIWIE
jgi:hypothetical protein